MRALETAAVAAAHELRGDEVVMPAAITLSVTADLLLWQCAHCCAPCLRLPVAPKTGAGWRGGAGRLVAVLGLFVVVFVKQPGQHVELALRLVGPLGPKVFRRAWAVVPADWHHRQC